MQTHFRLYYSRLLCFVACAILFYSGLAKADSPLYSEPDGPVAQEAAQKALAKLGPSGGALHINRDIYKIIGLSLGTDGKGLGLQSNISDVQKSLSDLGAQKTDLGYKIELSGDVLFDFDKTAIKPEAENQLQKLATAINGMGNVKVSISGHTDSKGSDEYNMDLSRRRAASVSVWLSGKMKNPQQVLIVSQGKGESQPVAENTKPDGSDNPQGRAKNRRVEIFIEKRN